MAHDYRLPDPCGHPLHPELHASRQSISSVSDPAYWRKLCPKLHVADKYMFNVNEPLKLPPPLLRGWREQIDEAGVARVKAAELRKHILLTILRAHGG